MGKIKWRGLVGLIKDQASLSKAAVISGSGAMAVLRATAHTPPSPPDERQLSAIFLLGETSRDSASPIISYLMDRLHRTGNCVVALKCLLLIHHIIKRGPFILQDQLSIFPATGGHNYLKLSSFRDGSTAATWALSSWIRWYASYLETLLSASRILGYFLGSSSNNNFRENQEQRISSLTNPDLVGEIYAFVAIHEEICRSPDFAGDTLVKEIIGFVSGDYLSSVNEILLCLAEVKERLSCLSFGDSVELVFTLKRLQDCGEGLSSFYALNKPSIEMMRNWIGELKEKIEMLKVYRDGGRLIGIGSREKTSESARFESRVTRPVDSVPSRSGRMEGIRYERPTLLPKKK